LDIPKFISVPLELKKSIGRLIGAEARDVILANSASYGIHLIADGFPWQKGGEICLMQNDFPSDILPWLALEKKGVHVRQIKADDRILTPQELEAALTQQTRLVCLSHVHTFSGMKLDIKGCAALCRRKNIPLIVNISQSAGTMPIDVGILGVDAVVCAGYKWLLGPYGTGFAWMTPELRDRLDINRAYWVSSLSEEELHSEGALAYRDLKSARKLDVFGTANFFNFVPFRTSIDYLLGIGLDVVQQYHRELLDGFINAFPREHYSIFSSLEERDRSSLLVFSHKDPVRNPDIHASLCKSNIYTALWKGRIRLSPHIYNTPKQLEVFAEHLQNLA
ncbi:MAG: aminotransferase class V-fold PLP-dependent enzyme, partial [Candidatus Omnitrophica bacterium]|nr:aminotransferase class V-fold PLP-dependent enzyme [Candidatus Omnitrophota bacterium]